MKAPVIFLLFLTSTAFAESSNPILSKDFELMMSWFPGEYDNQEQVYFEQELDVPEGQRHERIHHIFHPVQLNSFPGRTFYVQQYQNDDPDDIYRQRIYSFEPDDETESIRLSIYTPKQPEALKNAHLDISSLEGLTLDQVKANPGCEVFWKKQANQFIGTMKENSCSFVSSRSGKKILIQDDLVLTRNELWIRDRAVDEDDQYVFGNKAGIPHKNRKSRDFSCWMAIKRQDKDEFFFKSALELHDQGGTVWLTSDEEQPQTIGLKMRNVVWPYGRNKPSLVLYVYREGQDKAISYAWTEPHGERIGINLRWMQTSCSAIKK